MSVSVGIFVTFQELFAGDEMMVLGIMSHGDFTYLTGIFQPHYTGERFVDMLYHWLCEKSPEFIKIINEWRKQWDSNVRVLDLIKEALIEEEWFYHLIFLKIGRKVFKDVDDLKETAEYKQHADLLNEIAQKQLKIKKYEIHGMMVQQ